MKKWYLVLFTDKERTDLYKVLECYTIKQVAYLLNMKPQEVSNYFHKLIHKSLYYLNFSKQYLFQ